jgi:hypothetical protein
MPGKSDENMRHGGEGMKITVVIATLLLAAPLCQPQSRPFSGEIMDSQCAGMGSHDKMMQGVDAKNAKECTQKCVQLGGKYVLFDPAAKTVYQLDDQGKPAAYAGQKVTVKGSYNASNKTIHVESIEAQ